MLHRTLELAGSCKHGNEPFGSQKYKLERSQF